MKIVYNAINYVLEFSRDYKTVELWVKDAAGNRHKQKVLSTYPYTTARVVQLQPNGDRIVWKSASVGCHPLDKFTQASGRLWAMKRLTNGKGGFPKDFKAALWDAYLNRNLQPKAKVEDKDAQGNALPKHDNPVGADIPGGGAA